MISETKKMVAVLIFTIMVVAVPFTALAAAKTDGRVKTDVTEFMAGYEQSGQMPD